MMVNIDFLYGVVRDISHDGDRKDVRRHPLSPFIVPVTVWPMQVPFDRIYPRHKRMR